MKNHRIALALLSLALCLSLFAGCSNSTATTTTTAAAGEGATTAASGETVTLKVGATPNPHAEILAQIKELLAQEGITLEVVEFTDYPLINTALNDGSLDANFFQHKPYLDNYNLENKTELVSVGTVHYEPMGIFAGKTKTLDDLHSGGLSSGVALLKEYAGTDEHKKKMLSDLMGRLAVDAKEELRKAAGEKWKKAGEDFRHALDKLKKV